MNQTKEESVLQSDILEFDDFHVGIFEKSPLDFNPRNLAVTRLGADKTKICLARAASDHTILGFQKVKDAKYGTLEKNKHDVHADGVILTESKSAVVFRVGDCPILTIYEKTTKKALVLHCGRPAMTPTYKAGYFENIVSLGVAQLLRGVNNPEVSAHITGSICAEHFAHETDKGKALVAPFKRFGDVAFTDKDAGKLDLQSIIKHQLQELVPGSEEPSTDGLCPYENLWLASHRRHPEKRLRSPVVVVLQ